MALIIIATDRGLCGGLNSNLFKQVRSFLKDQTADEIEVYAYGRKAISFAKKQPKCKIIHSEEKLLDQVSFAKADMIAKEMRNKFVDKAYGEVYIAYPQFINALSQIPCVDKFLPISAKDSGEAEAIESSTNKELIVEPDPAAMFENLLTKKLSLTVFQAMLEARASEHGSRMTAMDSATSNATEVKKKLTLQYNRARQAAITKELIEIVSGAEAL